MRNLLASPHESVLERLARPDSLLAFDFDGTLAPIVANRDAARLAPGTRDLLLALSRRQPCALITGRGLSDVWPKIRGVHWTAVVGNHGAEWRPSLGKGKVWEARVKEWKRTLPPLLAGIAGVEIELKRFSLSIHYRRSRFRRRARASIRRALEQLGPCRIMDGNCIFNVLPAGLPDKGWAVSRLQRQLRAPFGLYAGDDTTDEDVFRSVSPDRLVSVRIGRSQSSAAKYFLPSQPDCDNLLRRLLELGPVAG